MRGRGNPAWLEAWDVAKLESELGSLCWERRQHRRRILNGAEEIRSEFAAVKMESLVNKCDGGAWTGCSLVTLRRRGGVHGSKRWRWVLGCIEE
ncbi:hypothetical protein M0R45_019752 [Rubus argutus]|uniref:Uncharacterized protein n=1 Tax=Rubus argutus TaxID=59490 RepID=A0AAW1X774_RUBAR